MNRNTQVANLVNSYVSFISNLLNNPENPTPPEGSEAETRCFQQMSSLKEQLEAISLTEFVNAIGEFPVIPEILNADASTLIIINRIKDQAKALKVLLKVLVLHEPLPQDNFNGEIWLRYGLAQWSKALLNLTSETFIRSSELQVLFPSASAAWACSIYSDFRCRLEKSGLLGTPEIVGKVDYLSHQGKAIKQYKDCDIQATDKTDVDWALYLPNFLYWQAQQVARSGDDYFYDNHYLPFWRIWQQFNQKVLRRNDFQGEYLLPDGTIFTTGSHRKIPKGLQPHESSAWRPTKTKRQRECKGM